jgi:hypothetical protein
VTGDGYTNHCPSCLWSLHVDVAPGDRAAGCGGAMRPVASERRGADWYVEHRCERCGFRRKNRIREDETAALIRLSRDWSLGA